MTGKLLKEIFLKSIESVQPGNLIKNCLHFSDNLLSVKNKIYQIKKPCYVVGFGKAVAGMAIEIENILKSNLKEGIVIVPKGIFNNLQIKSNKIEFIEGASNNIPDGAAMGGAKKIRDLIENLSIDDFLIVLISGGGSALLPLPKPPITLKEKQTLIKELSLKGANIWEINCVRKQISTLKGGGLVEIAYPCKMIALILSDVVGDPLDIIASGPTSVNLETSLDAITVLKKYLFYKDIPESIRSLLENHANTPRTNLNVFENVDNFIVGNNEIAAQRAREHAISLGFQSEFISTKITGDVSRISQIYALLARYLLVNPHNFEKILKGLNVSSQIKSFYLSKPLCLIGAGEPVVNVKDTTGKGGRNQQLALEFSLQIDKYRKELLKLADISFLSGGTDGIDGPTDAAGAIGTLDLVHNSLIENIKATDYADKNDSFTFFTKYNNGENLIKIGHTGTNVMDLHLLLIQPK